MVDKNISTESAVVPVSGVLASLLAEAAETQPDFGTSVEYIVKSSIEVVQSKGPRHDVSNVMRLYVGEKDVSTGKYLKDINFILVDTLYDTVMDGKYTKNRGARQMWTYKQNGGKWERDLESGGPACSSANGLQPRPEFLGKEVVDIRTGEMVKIGFEGDVAMSETIQYNNDQHVSVCGKCPLGQWRTDPDTGKRQPPPCNDAWGYVVYILPHPEDANVSDEERITEGFLAIIRGQNSGVQLALPGARAGTPPARQDGAALMGIVAPFKANPTTKNATIVRHVGEVQGAAINNVIGFATDESQTGFISAKMRNSDGSVNQLFAKLRNETTEYPYVLLSVPTYPYAPEGLPEEAGLSSRIKRVGMRVVKNGYKLGSQANPTLVPEIYITDQDVTLEEYTGYLTARALYRSTGSRGALMRFDLLRVTDDALQTGVLPQNTSETHLEDDLAV